MGTSVMLSYPRRRLPQEVVDMVIDFVDAPADWRQCARVCWSWVHASQLHLFRSISVSIGVIMREEYEPPVARLNAVLDKSPHLAKHVRELEIVRDFGQYFNIRMQDQLLASLIPLFPRIHTFSLKSEDGDQEFLIDASLLSVIRGVLQSSLVKSITLCGWEFRDAAHFITLMGDQLHSLSTFNVESIGIDHRSSPPTASVPKNGPPAILDTLTISSSMQGIDRWFESLTHPVIVKNLVLSGWGGSSPILKKFAKNLEQLNLIMEDDDDPPTDFNSFKRLTKLALPFSIESLDELQTLPEDNRLENLELLDIWFCDLAMSASSYKLLDEFLASKRFSNLKVVTMVVRQPSLTAEEFKLLRKTMRRIVGNGLLHLRFKTTGETLHSMQIQDQASRREIFLPSDFPWFVEALQVEEEEDEDEDEDEEEEIMEGSKPWMWEVRRAQELGPSVWEMGSMTMPTQVARNFPTSETHPAMSLEGNPTSVVFDDSAFRDFDAFLRSFNVHPVNGITTSDSTPTPSYHSNSSTLPLNSVQGPELGFNGFVDDRHWYQNDQQLPSTTQSNLVSHGVTHPDPQVVSDVSDHNEHFPDSSWACNSGSSVYSYFPYPNAASSSGSTETRAPTSYPSTNSVYSHTCPLPSPSSSSWYSSKSADIPHGHSVTNIPPIPSNPQYSYGSSDATNAPANHEAHTIPMSHYQVPHTSSLPSQPQFSIPEIPVPINPSYYKSTMEYTEDSLFTTVTEVINTSPYHRQVWFSQIPATESSTSAGHDYSADSSTTYPP